MIRAFAVPKLTGALLPTTLNPSRPATTRVFAKLGSTAVPVNRHKVDGVFVRCVGAENSWSEKTEFQLSLKQSDGFLVKTAATQQSAQIHKEIYQRQQKYSIDSLKVISQTILRVVWPNQQCHSTERRWLINEINNNNLRMAVTSHCQSTTS